MKRVCIALCFLLVSASPESSASFGLKPAAATFDARTSIAEFTFSTLSAVPCVFDVRVNRWTQIRGNDTYVPEPNIIVVPAILSLGAYDERLIRIKPRTPIEKTAIEQSFRLTLTQVVPGAVSPPPDARTFTGAIFVAPRERSGEAAFALQRTPGGMRLTIDNRANTHVFVGAFTIEANGKSVYSGRALGYVLAGASRSFDLRANPGTATEAQIRYADENGAPLQARAILKS